MNKWFAISIFLLGACGTNQEPVPTGILPQEKMVAVLKDIHIAEVALQSKRVMKDSLTKIYNNYYQEVYDKHNITEELFMKSFAYYEGHLDKLKQIYQELDKKKWEASVVDK